MTQWILTSCILIAAVLLIRFVGRDKLSARVRYALWALVLLRLLIPGSVGATSLSVLNYVPEADTVRELHHALLYGTSWHKADHYYILKDFQSYQAAKLQANRDYRDRQAFGRKCLINVASAGKFSADRTIRQYAEEIWHV